MLDDKDFAVVVGDFIRKARQQNKMTSEELAAESRLDYSTISLIENGKRQVKACTLYRILYALNIDLEELLSGKNTRSNEDILIDRIRKLDDSHIDTLNCFLSSFDITKRKCD